jgi:tetratricopeptide (TPR) repeat protein
LLQAVLVLSALLGGTSLYLLVIRIAGWASGRSLESELAVWMFFAHLAVGLLAVAPMVVFGVLHLRVARQRPNRRAVKVGYALFGAVLVVVATGIVLTRIEGILDIHDPLIRETAWWLHVIAPPAAVWLFVLHRLAGTPIRWKVGLGWLAAAGSATIALLAWHGVAGRSAVDLNSSQDALWGPSLARTADGERIPARLLANDAYCRPCHEDVHEQWSASVHRLSSFNNPAYGFSVRGTRRAVLERDGNVEASRFCAACHDPVPLFSGRFDDPDFDDVGDPTATVGITCSVCHSITDISSVRGNGAYVLATPVHYPFTFSDSRSLRWVNRQLIRARPELHRETFLKPIHRTAEFCSACHKVHIPESVNHYRWLRGQNHYDSHLLSGVSGHGVSSFYYPAQAVPACAGCHMPLVASADFGAKNYDDSGELTVHDHLFPGANTAVPFMMGIDAADEVIEKHFQYLLRATRIDIFGLRAGGTIDGDLIAPIRPQLPEVEPGGRYLVEVVIRTTGIGHHLTQGTVDSNQLWLDVTVTSGDRVIGRSGAMDAGGRVDPWSHFVNAYVVDREGRRIDRRNAEDIFVALYDNQIPPGSAAVVHYLLDVPEDLTDPIGFQVALRYRKFDTTFLEHIHGEPTANRLPVAMMAGDRLTLPVVGVDVVPEAVHAPAPEWERWNDYGIGLLLRGGRGELRQAEEAFNRVEALGRSEGPLNLARIYLREGRVASEAPAAIARAAALDPPAPSWSLLWFGGLIDFQNGHLDRAIGNFEQILEGGFPDAVGRGFDFSKDYRVLNQLGRALYLRALSERGEDARPRRERFLRRAVSSFERALELDPENLAAHWGLKQVFNDLGDEEKARHHEAEHALYKPDDNARDRAVAAARRGNEAADHAAGSVVVYPLRPVGESAE